MNPFDEKAKDWDKNQSNIERAEVIAHAIQQAIPLTPSMTGLEYGCGTGLLSFNLMDNLKFITLADNSPGMLQMLEEKITTRNIGSMKTLLLDLENEEAPDLKPDILYTQMALHHVMKLDLVLTKFHQMISSGGTIAIADLNKEDGFFHGDGFTGHNGFDPDDLALKLKTAGFENVQYAPCYRMKRLINEKEMEFPVFLMTGKKGGSQSEC